MIIYKPALSTYQMGHAMIVKILLLTVALLIPVSAQAANDLAQQALEVLRRGFAGTADFTAEITQEKQLSLMRQKLVSKGVVRFKKPDAFYMELYAPQASRLLLKDNVMTIRYMGQGTTNRVVLPPEEGLKKWFVYLAKPVNSLPEGMGVQAEHQGNNWVLKLFPKSQGAVQQLSLSFDSEGQIGKIEIDERNRDRTVIRFSKIKRNVGLRDRDFRVE
jgi:outer membrane lipoprotein carrier protein